ncbi:MAG: 1-acyl-sn-glycerol-3-phosphate acyltransferase [Saccharofermentanales bacterium]
MSHELRRRGPDRPSRGAYHAIRRLAHILLALFFRVKIRRDPKVHAVEGPLFIVGNHVSFLDPLFIGIAFPERTIRFVSGEEIANAKITRFFARKLALITIKPFHVNFGTTREIMRSVADGMSVALYPETQRTMVGDITPFDPATAKLIRRLNVPVANVTVRGGYLAWPRWSSLFRPGPVDVETSLLLSAEATQTLSVEDIQRRLIEACDVDDYRWQRERPRLATYRSRKMAEHLSYVLHRCPACDRPLTLRSKRHVVTCRHCGHQVDVARTGFLTAVPGSKAYFDDPLAWGRWQRRRVMAALRDGEVIAADVSLEFRETIGVVDAPARPRRDGRLILSSDGLRFEGRAGESMTFVLGDTPSLYCSFGHYANLVSGDDVWRAHTVEPGHVALLVDVSRALWIRQNRAFCSGMDMSE